MNIVNRHVSAPRGVTLSCTDGPQKAALRMLTCGPDPGVVRHAEAGNPDALEAAHSHGLDMPSLARHGGSAG